MPQPGPSQPGKGPQKPKLPSNAKSQAAFTMDELKKTAASRGITVEKLVAQMVEQYLREGKEGDKSWDGKI